MAPPTSPLGLEGITSDACLQKCWFPVWREDYGSDNQTNAAYIFQDDPLWGRDALSLAVQVVSYDGVEYPPPPPGSNGAGGVFHFFRAGPKVKSGTEGQLRVEAKVPWILNGHAQIPAGKQVYVHEYDVLEYNDSSSRGGKPSTFVVQLGGGKPSGSRVCTNRHCFRKGDWVLYNPGDGRGALHGPHVLKQIVDINSADDPVDVSIVDPDPKNSEANQGKGTTPDKLIRLPEQYGKNLREYHTFSLCRSSLCTIKLLTL